MRKNDEAAGSPRPTWKPRGTALCEGQAPLMHIKSDRLARRIPCSARHPAGGPSELFDRGGGGMPYQQIKALVDRHSFHVVLHALCQVACDRGLIPIFHGLAKIYEDTNPALRNADDPPPKGVDLDKLTDPERRLLLGDQ
jgi:hypothetical protein